MQKWIGLVALLLLCWAPPARADGPTARLAFVGDVMLGREIGRAIVAHGIGYPADALRPYLAGADLTFGNLESPLTMARRVAGAYDLHAAPAHGDVLKRLGFDVVALANNHAMDHGREGLEETLRTLAGLGIASIGAGPDQTTARAPLLREVHGVRLAFLAYEGVRGARPATAEQAGVAWLEPAQAVRDIAAARLQADVLIVSVHWGVEYQATPTAQQRALAQQMADAGADLIIGHHPHVVQPVVWLQGAGRSHPTLVAYSLGNFLFDMGFQADVIQTAILHCDVGPAGVNAFGLQPLQMRPWQIGPAEPAVGQAVLSRLLTDRRVLRWQTIPLAGAAGAATVWELGPAAIQRARPDLSAAQRDALSGARLLVEARSVIDATRMVAALQYPPAWFEPDASGMAGGNRESRRLQALGWDGQRWRALGRGVALRGPVYDLACHESAGALLCAFIETPSSGDQRLAGWRWEGGRWRRVWQQPAGAYRGLLWWDADSDGQRDLLGLDIAYER